MLFFSYSGINSEQSDSNPEYLTVAGDYLFFAATHTTYGREVFMRFLPGKGIDVSLDGSPAKTLKWFDLVKGSKSSNPTGFEASRDSDRKPVLPVYFAATTPSYGSKKCTSMNGECDGMDAKKIHSVTLSVHRRAFFALSYGEVTVQRWVLLW
jgi:hypothetical protein